MKPAREDIEFEPIGLACGYTQRILRWADIDAEITFGWRIFVRGQPFGAVWIEMFGELGLIHGLTAVRGRYVPFVSREAFLLCESAAKSLGLIPAVVYPKEYLHVKRLCDIVGYRHVIYDDGANIGVRYGKKSKAFL